MSVPVTHQAKRIVTGRSYRMVMSLFFSDPGGTRPALWVGDLIDDDRHTLNPSGGGEGPGRGGHQDWGSGSSWALAMGWP